MIRSIYACALILYGSVAAAQSGSVGQSHITGQIFGWGEQVFDSTWQHQSFVEIAAGDSHTLARRSDGAVVACGWNYFGQCNVPPMPDGVSCVQLAAGADHSLARYSDGSVAAWGNDVSGQCDVPTLPPGVSFRAVAAGGVFGFSGTAHSLAVLSDGSLRAWGNDFAGQCDVPVDPPGTGMTKL